MKHLLFIITVMVIWSCSSSPEDKANELIKQDLRKTLYKPETYKPVETKIDSAFAPMDSPEIYSIFQEMIELGKDAEQQKFTMESEESSMAIWSGPYQSEFGRTEYNQAKRKYDEAKEQLNKSLYKAFTMSLDLIDKVSSKKKFMGWKVRHNYRADNNAGQTLIGNQIYIIDDNFTKILYSCDADEYDAMQKVFDESMKQMKETKKNLDANGVTTKDLLHKRDSLIANGHTMMEINEKGLGSF